MKSFQAQPSHQNLTLHAIVIPMMNVMDSGFTDWAYSQFTLTTFSQLELLSSVNGLCMHK